MTATTLLVGPLVSTAQAYDDSNPPAGDEETYSQPTLGPEEATAASATLEAIGNCMKKRGEVPSSAPAYQFLGDVSASTGLASAPTGTAVQPSEFCGRNGTYTVENTIAIATDAELLPALKNLDRDAQVGKDIMPPDGWKDGGGNAGGGGGGTTTTPKQSSGALTTSSTSATLATTSASLSSKRYWTNRRGQVNSLGTFMAYRYSPSYLIWSTDECSAPRILGNGPYGFRNSCIRHDFNYRNLKSVGGFSRVNKARADTRFEVDMVLRCVNAYSGGTRTRCRTLAFTYGSAVRAFQWPNTTGYWKGGSYTW